MDVKFVEQQLSFKVNFIKELFMNCSMCEKDEPSTCNRPITMGGLGEAETQPICDKCYEKILSASA